MKIVVSDISLNFQSVTNKKRKSKRTVILVRPWSIVKKVTPAARKCTTNIFSYVWYIQ